MTGGRKPKPVTLDRVTYTVQIMVGTRNNRGWVGPYGLAPFKHRRLTVRVYRIKKHAGCGDYVIWDKARDSRGGFLYRDELIFPRRTFRTRAAAWRYLKTHTEESKEYKQEMVERVLDGEEAA